MKLVHRVLCLSLAIYLPVCSTGCASMAARWGAFLQCKSETHLAKQQMRQEELEALKAQIEAERKALLAEREMELAQLRAQSDQRSCQLRSQYEESVRTQLGLDLDQRVKIGQLQVNTEELHQLLEERERDHADRMRVFKQLKDQQTRSQLDQWKQAQMGGPCCTCSQSACEAPGPACEVPCRAGCCQRCGLPTQPLFSNDCAGNRPFREAPTRPLQEPLTAANIPMMLPVTIEVGMTNSRIDESKVRRLPLQESAPLNDSCGQCDACKRGRRCKHCAQSPSCVPSGCTPSPSCESPSYLQRVFPWTKPSGAPTPLPEPAKPIKMMELPEPVPASEAAKRDREAVDGEFPGRSKTKLASWEDEIEDEGDTSR